MLCRVPPIEGDAYIRGGRNSGQLCQGWIENSYLLSFLQVMTYAFITPINKKIYSRYIILGLQINSVPFLYDLNAKKGTELICKPNIFHETSILILISQFFRDSQRMFDDIEDTKVGE